MSFSPLIGVSIMLEGRCPKCGKHYYGWALRNPKYQTCPNCGIELQIKESNGTVSEGYSPPIIDTGLLKEIMKIVDDNEKKPKDRDMKDDI
jgi:DNA-directed RNA polymerase subunit RPC12/RpoP